MDHKEPLFVCAVILVSSALNAVRSPGYTRVTVETGIGLEARGSAAQAGPQAILAPRDDLSLVQAIARGEAGALEALYDRYATPVYSVAAHLLSDRGAAEEVVQETFLKLWRRPDTYQPSRGRLLPWLIGVAHHHAVDLLRRRQLEQRHRAGPVSSQGGPEDMIDDPRLASPEDDPVVRVGQAEQRRALAGALAELPEAQRIPLQLAYYRGLTQVEIAERLGEPLGTVKTRMRLGLQRLRLAPVVADMWTER